MSIAYKHNKNNSTADAIQVKANLREELGDPVHLRTRKSC